MWSLGPRYPSEAVESINNSPEAPAPSTATRHPPLMEGALKAGAEGKGWLRMPDNPGGWPLLVDLWGLSSNSRSARNPNSREAGRSGESRQVRSRRRSWAFASSSTSPID